MYFASQMLIFSTDELFSNIRPKWSMLRSGSVFLNFQKLYAYYKYFIQYNIHDFRGVVIIMFTCFVRVSILLKVQLLYCYTIFWFTSVLMVLFT